MSIESRHGLSGALCPACNKVVSATSDGQSSMARRRPKAPAGPTVCPECGGPRDRDVRRCRACGTAWLYRVVALRAAEEQVRARLVEYVAHRQTLAEPRDRLLRRFAEHRAVVLDRLTESQAQRVRQEVEAFGTFAEVERDAAASIKPLRTGPSAARVVAITLVAFAVLAVGLYQVVTVAEESPAPEEPASAPDPAAVSPTSAAAPDAPPAEARPAPVEGPGPVDALAGVALAGETERRPAFFVDLDGWAVGLVDVANGGRDTQVVFGGQSVRALLARRGAGTRLALYRMRAAAPFALSLGDASVLAPGDRLFVADPVAGRLLHTNVVEAGHRVGRAVYVRFEAPTPPLALDGAPLFDARGLVVGVFDHALSMTAAMPLAVPINQLTDGEDALLTLVQPARRPTPKMVEWLRAADEADRADKPEVYASIEATLLMTVTCPGSVCTGRVGVLGLASGAPGSRTLEAQFYALDQKQGDAPRFGKTRDIDITVDWHAAPVEESLLVGALDEDARRAVLRGDVGGLSLNVASYRVRRPPPRMVRRSGSSWSGPTDGAAQRASWGKNLLKFGALLTM